MADSKNASFIPKQSDRPRRKVRTTHRIYILSYVSNILFFGTLIIVAGTFFYSFQIDNTLKQQKQLLRDERSNFSGAAIEEIRTFEQRLLVVQELVARTSAPSRIFAALEDVVAENARFVDFKYERLNDQRFSLAVVAQTDTFTKALFQREVTADNSIFDNLTITEFDYGVGDQGEGDGNGQVESDENSVVFTFMGDVPHAAVAFDPSVYSTVETVDIDAGDISLTEVDADAEEIFEDTPEAAVTNTQ